MTDHSESAYLKLLSSGELSERARLAYERLSACDICARRCGANRLVDDHGASCRTGELAIVASYGPHFGEENPLRGHYGSGTIFFSWCNLRCIFCQNSDISQYGSGRPVILEELARRLPGLRLVEDQDLMPVETVQFRGPKALWVEWD